MKTTYFNTVETKAIYNALKIAKKEYPKYITHRINFYQNETGFNACFNIGKDNDYFSIFEFNIDSDCNFNSFSVCSDDVLNVIKNEKDLNITIDASNIIINGVKIRIFLNEIDEQKETPDFKNIEGEILDIGYASKFLSSDLVRDSLTKVMAQKDINGNYCVYSCDGHKALIQGIVDKQRKELKIPVFETKERIVIKKYFCHLVTALKKDSFYKSGDFVFNTIGDKIKFYSRVEIGEGREIYPNIHACIPIMFNNCIEFSENETKDFLNLCKFAESNNRRLPVVIIDQLNKKIYFENKETGIYKEMYFNASTENCCDCHKMAFDAKYILKFAFGKATILYNNALNATIWNFEQVKKNEVIIKNTLLMPVRNPDDE